MAKTNAAELEWETLERGGSEWKRKRLGAAAGGDEIGCSLYELPAEKRSWPYHYHAGNEEALFVLEGAGTLRLDGDELALESGDYVALPAGERGAHRVVNDSPGALRYLLLSTMNEPDVTVYPDSEKVGVFAGSPPGGDGERDVHGYYRLADGVDYWTDEEPA
ncbi:cupin domain-containing protein [Halovivax sp.]|uniref:cupin domain-containing protein n=1 Tax=Halovivax sp. TaxID=1935978 RepID=UPI0025C04440|nr:cupin domain-containing protein [Halovivax sp.]